MVNKEKAAGFEQLYQDVLTHVLKGKGFSPESERQAAFDNAGLSDPLRSLVDKVANRAYQITDNDIDTMRITGVSEDQIFELVICAAVGEASRQYTSGLCALAEALTDTKGGPHAA